MLADLWSPRLGLKLPPLSTSGAGYFRDIPTTHAGSSPSVVVRRSPTVQLDSRVGKTLTNDDRCRCRHVKTIFQLFSNVGILIG